MCARVLNASRFPHLHFANLQLLPNSPIIVQVPHIPMTTCQRCPSLHSLCGLSGRSIVRTAPQCHQTRNDMDIPGKPATHSPPELSYPLSTIQRHIICPFRQWFFPSDDPGHPINHTLPLQSPRFVKSLCKQPRALSSKLSAKYSRHHKSSGDNLSPCPSYSSLSFGITSEPPT